jgi:hypothetical protein
MNTLDTRSYTQDAIRRNFYDTAEERQELFGHSIQALPPMQKAYMNEYLNGPPLTVMDVARAPRTATQDMKINSSQKSRLSNTLYDDILRGVAPQFHTDWKPLTTPVTERNTIFPHQVRVSYHPYDQPVEIAPRNSEKIWLADLNPAMYERRIALGAEEHPNKLYHARKRFMQALAAEMPSRSDPYTRRIEPQRQAEWDIFPDMLPFVQVAQPPATINF